MTKIFDDINLPGFSTSKKKEPQENVNSDVENEEQDQEEQPEDEVKLLSTLWKPGPRGFDFNESCFLEVKVEFLKETIRTRVRGKLFCIYNGVEEDLKQEIQGFIDKKTNTVLLKIDHLWFAKDHYDAWLKDKSAPCIYKVKDITHSRGANTIDSNELKMPRNNFYLRLDIDPEDTVYSDDTFTLSSTDSTRKFKITKTVKDDLIKDDRFLDIVFEDLDPDLKYSLEINPGKDGAIYQVFEDLSLFTQGDENGQK